MDTLELYGHIHENLYINVHLLTMVYPASKTLKDSLAPDMFVKPNKQMFEEIVYYLLKILDPGNVKQSIPWPLYNKKMECEFRSEVKKYLSSINDKYEYANIPPVLSSHLLTPGGNKFVCIMWKLSQLVLMECVLKNCCANDDDPILLPMKARKNTMISSAILRNFDNVVKNKSSEVNADFTKKNELCEKYANKAKEMYESSIDIEKEISEERNKHANLIKSGLGEQLEISDEDFSNSVELLKTKLLKFKKIEHDIHTVVDLTKKIQNPSVLSYEQNSLKVPESLKHKMRHKNTNKLNLIDFLRDIKEILLIFTKEFENHDYFDADKLIQIHENSYPRLQKCINSFREYENKLRLLEADYRVKLNKLRSNLLTKESTQNSSEDVFKFIVKSPVVTFNTASNSTNSSLLLNCSTKPSQISFKNKFITPFKTSTTIKNNGDKLHRSIENKNIVKPLFSSALTKIPSPIEKESEKNSNNKFNIKKLVNDAVLNTCSQQSNLSEDYKTILHSDSEVFLCSTPLVIEQNSISEDKILNSTLKIDKCVTLDCKEKLKDSYDISLLKNHDIFNFDGVPCNVSPLHISSNKMVSVIDNCQKKTIVSSVKSPLRESNVYQSTVTNLIPLNLKEKSLHLPKSEVNLDNFKFSTSKETIRRLSSLAGSEDLLAMSNSLLDEVDD